MKTQFTFMLLVLSSLTNNAFSQPPRTQIVASSSSLAPNYTKATDLVDTVHLNLQLFGDYDSADDTKNKVTFTLQKGTLIKSPLFSNGKVDTTLEITQNLWPGAGKFAVIPIILYIRNLNQEQTLKTDQVGEITLAGQVSNAHTIRLTNNLSPYNPAKSFWIEVGANFDLVDGLEPNNFFSGVFFHKRDIRPFTRKNKTLGVFAGIYESKAVSTVEESQYSILQYYNSNSFTTGDATTMKIYTGFGNYTVKRVARNIGLFFSPQVRLSNKSSIEDGLHFFTSIWIDLQWQRINEEKAYTEIRKIDSNIVGIDSLSLYHPNNYKKEIDIRSHYLGWGLPVFYKETFNNESVHLFLNPVIGLSNQPTRQYLIENLYMDINKTYRPWHPFYIVQFRLNEEKYGISFTGEVRGLLCKNNPPFVSLALSKKFDLKKFIEFQ